MLNNQKYAYVSLYIKFQVQILIQNSLQELLVFLFSHIIFFLKKKVGKKPRKYFICIPKRDTQNSSYEEKKSCNFCIFLSQTMSLKLYVYKVIRRKIYKKIKIHPQQTTRSKSCSECIRWMNDLALYRFTISQQKGSYNRNENGYNTKY